MSRSTDGTRGKVRQSALWGSGNRGGEFRTNALWGKGGRDVVTSVVAAATLMLPLAAMAGDGDPSNRGREQGRSDHVASYVAPELLMAAQQDPKQKVRVIIRAPQGIGEADNAFAKLRKGLNRVEQNESTVSSRHEIVDALVVEMRAKHVLALQRQPGLEITSDSEVVLSDADAPTSRQLWPYASGSSRLWDDDTDDYSAKTPTIAVVDSGVEALRGRTSTGAFSRT